MSLSGFANRKFLLLAGLVSGALLLGAAASAAAQASAAPQAKPAAAASRAPSAKVGVVNMQEAIAGTVEGKKSLVGLEQKFAPKQTEFKTRQEEVSTLRKQLQDGGDKLSEDERGKRTAELAVKQRALQQDFETAQGDFQKAEQEAIGPISAKMMDVLEKYAKAHGYAVILDVSSQQTSVVWAAEGTNVTKDLISAYDAASATVVPAAPAKP